MRHYNSSSTVRPKEWDTSSSLTRVYHNQNIREVPAKEDTPLMYEYEVDEYNRTEYATVQDQRISEAQAGTAVGEIVFCIQAETGAVDEVTATEHMEAFSAWQPNVNYAIGNLRTYDGKLYKCVQAHTSQTGWEPSQAVSLWTSIGDPREEWPEWSQPIGAHDAYAKGDKVSHNGSHWISTADNNVWEPGVFGWEAES